MDAIRNWLDGKKTYITAALVGVAAVLQYYGITIPEYVYAFLGALGITFMRGAVEKSGPMQ